MSNDSTGPQARFANSIARLAASTQALREDLQREAVEGPKRTALFEAGLAETLQNQRDIASQTAQIIKNQTLLADDLVRRISPLVDKLRVDVMERANRHEDKLSAIRDDIAVNFGTADHALRVNNTTRDDVGELFKIISNMRRQIQRLRTEVDDLKEQARTVDGKPGPTAG